MSHTKRTHDLLIFDKVDLIFFLLHLLYLLHLTFSFFSSSSSLLTSFIFFWSEEKYYYILSSCRHRHKWWRNRESRKMGNVFLENWITCGKYLDIMTAESRLDMATKAEFEISFTNTRTTHSTLLYKMGYQFFCLFLSFFLFTFFV